LPLLFASFAKPTASSELWALQRLENLTSVRRYDVESLRSTGTVENGDRQLGKGLTDR